MIGFGQRIVPGALLAIVAVAGPCRPALAQATPAQNMPAPAPAGKLTGPAAWQALVGNTVVATTRAGGYSELYTVDGVVKHLDRDGTSTGSWKLQGQKVCFDYPEEDDASCVAVEVEGTKGAFVDDDATRDTFDILPGNPKNL